eukprot:NODE_1761_length_1074_cov_173.657561_g1437_i0.p1 GENE.NODE_1761_length_1074_cov_173.657561_g1437_i0~~NODE_1761_length_1074_cov_173.657561_g1437_i0.p1  ORF type:complete len:322 (+),score=110.93 NODE_1761_length_1074_cov_173.657561_g1437_i0:56-1021(+)
MDEELEKVGIDRDTLKQTLAGKDEKLAVLLRNVKKNSQLLDDKERLISLLLRELTELVTEDSGKKMVFRLKEIIMKYNARYQKEDVANERDKTQEFERQRDYMEAQLASTKRQASRKEDHMRHDNVRKTTENALLVKEINDLRHEKKVLSTKLALTELHLKEAKAAAATNARTPGSPVAAHSPRAFPTPSDTSQKKPSGKLVKGPTRALRDFTQMDPNKVAEIVATVERNNAEMTKQQEEIRRLRDFVQHLLARAEQEKQAASLLKEYQSPPMAAVNTINQPDGSGGEARPSSMPAPASGSHEVSVRASSAEPKKRILPDI